MKGRWLTYFLTLSLLITGLSPGRAFPAKAKVPIDMEIYMDGANKVGGELVITVTAKPLLPAPRIKITINLPEGMELESGDLVWEGSMSKGEEKDLEVSVKILKEGLLEVIGVAAIEYPDGSRLVKSASSIVEVGQKNKAVPPGVKKKDRNGQDIIEFE